MSDETITPERSVASLEAQMRLERALADETRDTVYSVTQTAHTRELLARLAGARRSVTFYPRGHVVVRDNMTALMGAIAFYLNDGFDVPLVFFDDEVLLGEQLLAQESVIFDQLIRDMTESGQTSVSFLQGLEIDELERAMQVLACDSHALDELGGLEAAVSGANIPHVQIGTVAFARDAGEFAGPQEANNRLAYLRAIDAVREFGERAASSKPISAYHVRDAARSIVDNVLGNRGAMLELGGLKSHDEYTFFHSVNVTILSVALGSLISDNRRFLNSLGVGALMHDLGKMTVDLKVLNKSGPLTADEWEAMRLHPVSGAELAASMRGLDRSAIVVILEHHMRYDLDGYPTRTPRRPQHLTSRIVALVDAYDAMTSNRSYAPARPQDEAMAILAKNAGTAFDPTLVRVFTQMMGIYPARSVVRLSSGETAIVIRSNSDVVAPSVRIITTADGTFVTPHDVDLSDEAAAAGRRIEACLDAAELNIEVDEYL